MVKDKDIRGKLGVAYIPKYTEAIIKLLQWRQQKNINSVYSIVEVEL